MRHPLLEKPIVPVMNPTENQKAVLTKIVAAETPKLAAADISKSSNLVSARDMLKKLGFITLDDEGAALTDAGTKVTTDQGLTDDMGELTDTGRKIAFADDPEKEAETSAESGFGGEEDMDMGMGESLIQILRAQSITESLNKVPEKLLNSLSQEEQKQLHGVLGGSSGMMLMDYDSLWDKLYEFYWQEMPYGVAKARTGDPDQWVHNKLT